MACFVETAENQVPEVGTVAEESSNRLLGHTLHLAFCHVEQVLVEKVIVVGQVVAAEGAVVEEAGLEH